MRLLEEKETRLDKRETITCKHIFELITTLFDRSAMFNCLLAITIQVLVIVWAMSFKKPKKISINVRNENGTLDSATICIATPKILHIFSFLLIQSIPSLLIIYYSTSYAPDRNSEAQIVGRILRIFSFVKLIDSHMFRGDFTGLGISLAVLAITQYKNEILPLKSNGIDIAILILVSLIPYFIIHGLNWLKVRSKSQSVMKMLEDENLKEHKEKIIDFCEKNSFPIERIVFSDGCPPVPSVGIFQFLLKSQAYIVVHPQVFTEIDPDSLLAVLKHELAHRDYFNHLTKFIFMKSIVPTILFTMIINGGSISSIDQALILCSKIVLVSNLLGIANVLMSNFMEYRADRKAIDTPESATGLARMDLKTIKRCRDPTKQLFGRDYNIFSTHPFHVNRIQRISERYPGLVTVTCDSEQSSAPEDLV